MDATELKALQNPLKERYRQDPGAALVTLRAQGRAGEGISCRVETGRALAEGARDHAWFVAYAPADHPKIAVAVVVEHGGHGGSAAAPVAKKVIEEYLKNVEPKTVR